MSHSNNAARRDLTFETVNDVIEDVNQISVADAAGTLEVCGQWTAGEILSHLSAWIEYGYEGYPIDAPPWLVRQVMKLMLRSMLKSGMKPGIRIPGIDSGTVGQTKMPTQEACQRYLMALNRMASREKVVYPSPAFGEMDHAKRVKLNLRHAELHLSFLRY